MLININNDANFSTTMTNLIATKVGLTSNNTISGSNTFTGTHSIALLNKKFPPEIIIIY